MVWDSGPLDGREIDWAGMFMFGLIDTVVWAGVILVSITRHSIIRPYITRIGAIILLVQAISTGIASYQAPPHTLTGFSVEESSKYEFSSDKNIVIYIIDSFQSDMFDHLMKSEPGYVEALDGFTYFPDATSGYPSTYPSIPNILTGAFYDNKMPVSTFLTEAYSENSLPVALKRTGYHVYLPLEKYVLADTSVASNFLDAGGRKSLDISVAVKLLNVSAFTFSPHFLKKFFYHKIRYIRPVTDNGREVHEDVKFINEIRERITVELRDSAFKLYHLKGMHRPLRLNEHLDYEEMGYSLDNVIRQAKAELKIVDMFLELMKKAGIYDNSMIFIIADHGAGSPEIPAPSVRNDMSFAAPLFLFKPFGARGGLKLSSAPVELADIPATVFSALGMEADTGGTPITEIAPDSARQRRFLSLTWHHEDWDRDYMPAMREYVVSGHSWEMKSWERTGRDFALIKSKASADVPEYALGETLYFGKKGYAKKYLGEGWSYDDLHYTPTDGKRATLLFSFQHQGQPLIITAELIPYTAGGRLESQTVRVVVGGSIQAVWKVSEGGVYRAVLPAGLESTSPLEIILELPDAVSMAELGAGIDTRKLGVGLHSLRIEY
jgi:hypothetical protein